MEEISVSFMDPMTVDLSLFNEWLNGVSGIFSLFLQFIGGWDDQSKDLLNLHGWGGCGRNNRIFMLKGGTAMQMGNW